MSEAEAVSPTSLSAYLYCPRKYDFSKEQRIQTPDEGKRYLQQGLALHKTIEWTAESVSKDAGPETIYETAIEFFADAWEQEVERAEFASDAHHEYFRRLGRGGIEHYFDPEQGPGIDHARRSIAVEKKLTGEHDGIPLYGYADNILQTESGLHIIDYKRNLRGMISSGTADRLQEHLEGEEHEPGRVKNAIQAAAYIEGVKNTDLYSEGMDVRFSFYGLLYSTDIETGPDGYSVSVRGLDREVTQIYAEQYPVIRELIETAYTGIADDEFAPEPWDLIRDEGCDDCEFKQMCPDYLGSEVRIE